MFVLLITGGLGAGKSTAASFLADRGAVVLDLDTLAKDLLAKGSPLLARVAEQFGDVLLADGSLDAAALARAAFVSADATARLDAIVHPAVAAALRRELESMRAQESAPELVVVEVPLLAEVPSIAASGDAVVAVVAPEHVRLDRAMDRGMTEADARNRMARQATDARRAALATDVVVNAGSEQEFLGEIEALCQRYGLGAGRRS